MISIVLSGSYLALIMVGLLLAHMTVPHVNRWVMSCWSTAFLVGLTLFFVVGA